MDSKMQTGLLLVLGAISSAVGWIVIYPATGTGGAQGMAKDIMADPGLAQVGILLGYGGMIAVVLGLINISRKILLAGGAGSSYANISAFINMALIPLMLVGVGLELGVAQAASAQGGVALMEVAKAIGDPMSIPMGVALVLLAVGIAREKTFHVAVAAFAVLVGVILAIGVPGLLFEVGSDLAEVFQIAGWMGFMLTALILGVLKLRAK